MNEDLTISTDRVTAAISRDALVVVEDACLRPTAEGRKLIEKFVNSLSFEPMVGVKHNGNVTLAQHPAVMKEVIANSRFSEASFSHPLDGKHPHAGRPGQVGGSAKTKEPSMKHDLGDGYSMEAIGGDGQYMFHILDKRRNHAGSFYINNNLSPDKKSHVYWVRNASVDLGHAGKGLYRRALRSLADDLGAIRSDLTGTTSEDAAKAWKSIGADNVVDEDLQKSKFILRRVTDKAVANAASKFGCLMAMLPSLDSTLPNWAADNIPANCLHDEGIETEPHVTVLYGFDLAFDVERLKSSLTGLKAVNLTLGPVTRFECEEYDVLKLTVHSHSLVVVNSSLADTFKDDVTVTKWVTGDGYDPHVTIAYVKKGECKDLDGRTDFQGLKLRVTQLVYSLPDEMGRKVIDLNGSPAAVEGARRVPVSFEAPNSQDDRTDTQKAHDRIRKEAQKAIERAVAQVVALAEAEAIAKKRREEDDEFFLYATALFTAALAASYGKAARKLSALAGNQDEVVMKIDEDNFAKERSEYLENFPRKVREAIDEQIAQGTAAGEDERKVAERVRQAGDDILEGEGATVAETESQAIYGHAQLRALKRAGYETMFWVQLDRPTKRDSHEQNMNEGEVKIGHTFKASNQKFPGDPAGGAGECINCLCYLEGASRRAT